MKIILINQWFQRYSLLSTEELLEKPFLEIFPDLKDTRTEKSIKLCLDDNQYSILTHSLNPYPFPLYENHKDRSDGKRIYQYLHIIPIPLIESNKSICMIQISDVSQQVIRENMLREQMNLATSIKEEAIRASNAKSEFLASMSHEIRTPLNSILGMTELLEETSFNSDQKRYLEVLRNSGKALFNIINDILDFSRIEAGKLEIENHPYSLINVIDETLSLFFLRAKNKGVRLESQIFPGLATSVYGDPTRVQQILINLLGNAIKFTQEGSIILSVNHELDPILQKEILLIEVKDTGIGIPAEKLDKIFESFTQVDNSTTRKFGGTGLGLAISKKLADLMGGKISVSSENKKGSLFSVRLPYLPYIDDEHLLSSSWDGIEVPEPKNFPKLKILLAEDSPENIFLVQSFLRKYPIEIDVAENGKVAYDKSNLQHYDLVLMDMQMPIMDGNEAILHIREREAKNGTKTVDSLPIIALTANVAKEDIKKSFESGCNSYLTKPVKKQDLLKIIYFYSTTKS
jgi:signal transduction histidine kinase/CheY-like chemotaxis protein